MKIQTISTFSSNYKRKNANTATTFKAASDISLEYVYKNHAKYLPARMINKIRELLQSGNDKLPQLYELHNDVYKGLFDAKTLEEAKTLYPELDDVEELTVLNKNRSKAVKAIKKIMPLERFSLFILKKLYRPTSQDNLVKELGLTNRSILSWLSNKLKIKKLDGSYIKLLRMSNEEENSRISELSRRAIYANPEAQQKRLAKAAQAHRTKEYRTKKKQEMVDFYKRNPEVAHQTSLISQRTWDMCPEIKEKLSLYTRSLNPYVKIVLSKKQSGASLTPDERRVITGYYRGFWEQYPQLKRVYQERRLQVIDALKKTGVIKS